MKKSHLISAFTILLAVNVWLFWPQGTSTPQATAGPRSTVKSALPARALPPQAPSTPYHVTIGMMKTFNAPDSDIHQDIAAIQQLFFHYAKHQSSHPNGDNIMITAALLGENEKRIRYIDPSSSWISAQGELLDRWGTPLFLHRLSAKETEITSAGPDKELWTKDDIAPEKERKPGI